MRLTRAWRRRLGVGWVLFYAAAFVGFAGVPTIHYPPVVQAISDLSICVLIVGPILTVARHVSAPMTELFGTLGGIVVSWWDVRVPGQRGVAELIILSAFAWFWLIATAAVLSGSGTEPSGRRT